MEKTDVYDPYRRPARRTQWIVSTLAYHYGLDRGVENEIIVLATGLDQYLQEIFHHMDCQGDGKIPVNNLKVKSNLRFKLLQLQLSQHLTSTHLLRFSIRKNRYTWHFKM